MCEGSACPWLWHLSMPGHRYPWKVQDYLSKFENASPKFFMAKTESWDPQGRDVQITAQKIKEQEYVLFVKNENISFFSPSLNSPKVLFWSDTILCFIAFPFEQNVLPSLASKNLKMKTHLFHFGESRKRCFITSEFFCHLFL